MTTTNQTISVSELKYLIKGQVIALGDANYDPTNLFHLNQNIPPAGK